MQHWYDQSGNGRIATMTVASRQPFFVPSTLNGAPVIRFAGAQSMYLDVLAQLRWENGSQALFVGLGNNFPIVTAPAGNTRVYHALSARYDGSILSVYRDGNLTLTRSFTTSGPWTLASVGSWFSTYFLQGDLAEVIMYDHPLSDAERTAVDGYLRARYGLP